LEFKTPTREEKVAAHVRGIKVVLLSSLMGVVAGFLSSPYFLSAANVSFSFLILALAIYVQKYLFPFIGVKSSEFVFKDWFFISFMTFCFWYISWTIILNPPIGGQPQLFGPFF
jgi:ABC-type anion transport system duplicated permease subunit